MLQENGLKLAKEAFVSGHEGGTMAELVLCIFLMPVSCFTNGVVHSFFVTSKIHTCWLSTVAQDFALLAVPILVSQTFPHHTPALLLGLLSLSFALLAVSRRPILSGGDETIQWTALQQPHKGFVTDVRAGLMLACCVAILGVDFPLFPRRFAKTETWGTSLMDLGVGGFVFSSALTAWRPGLARSEFRTAMRRAAPTVLPLVVLGGLRLVATRATNYQEHVSEYGVHWNFFFTLAGVALLAMCLSISPRFCGVAGAVLLIGYQWLLSRWGLAAFILEAPRVDLLSANKEGVCSLCAVISFDGVFGLCWRLTGTGFMLAYGRTGFFALFLVGVWIGAFVQRAESVSCWRWKCLQLWAADAALWILTVVCYEYVAPPSRRMANMTYVLWVLSMSVGLLASHLLCTLLLRKPHASHLFRAVNRNQLATFMLANLLTGAVNLSMDTLAAENTQAFAVLLLYLGVVCGVSLVWFALGWTLKCRVWWPLGTT